jgi:two-component sensor histidine kinase
VRCTRVQNQEGDLLEIVWLESVMPGAVADAADMRSDGQFGSTVLERVVPAAVNGRAEYHLTPRLVSYRLVFPARCGDAE